MSARTGPNKTYDYLIKLLLIGDSGVGKSNLLLRFVDDQFEANLMATIGIDFKIKTIVVGQSRIKLQIWDTAGQERFRTITTAYYRGAMGILLVYDVTNETSFRNVNSWVRNLQSHASETAVLSLVGNKSDLEPRRVVTKEQGQKCADMLGIPFFESSAKNSENVERIFMDLVDRILDKLQVDLNRPTVATDPVQPSVDLKFKPKQSATMSPTCCSGASTSLSPSAPSSVSIGGDLKSGASLSQPEQQHASSLKGAPAISRHPYDEAAFAKK